MQRSTSTTRGDQRNLAHLVGDKRVLDIGCADGELSYFLEAQGLRVTAIDHPRSNHNGLAGLRALRGAFNSELEIVEADLDGQFSLDGHHYGLGFLLGALYHLKNPIFVLETLSRHLSYCFLSTRIMRYLPGEKSTASGQPIAYLLDETELNADNSNFWIFTEAALRRLLRRSNWRILNYLAVGHEQSDPVSARDERAFCLLESTYALADVELVSGWHQPEQEGWRWTERTFRANVIPLRFGALMLSVRLFIPEALVRRFGAIQLSITMNGLQLPSETYPVSGEYRLERRVQAQGPLQFVFSLNQALPPDDDPRERGIIVAALKLE
ncbi:MAG: methyltransferase domain-containing protein [Bryobacteraceae bacterium]